MTTATSNPSLTLLERLGRKISASQHDITRTQEKLAQQTREAQELKGQLTSLMTAVANAEARIKFANEQFQTRKRLIEERYESFLDAWGNGDLPSGPDYTPFIAIKASIDDFPNAVALLTRKLEAAKKELSDFEKKHSL